MPTEIVTRDGQQYERITHPVTGALISETRYSAPGPVRFITIRQFIDRMTLAKYSAMLAQSKYQAWRDYLLSGDGVDLDAEATVQGLAYAVSEGDLTSGDVTRIRGL